jgi:Spy/CpxP family protein refolding chaperone
MSRINAAALGAALLIGFAGLAGAQATQTPGAKAPSERHDRGMEGRRGFGGRRGGEFGGRLAKDLNLTDAQKAQFKSIHEKYKPQFEAVRTQFKGQAENARALRAKGDTAGARAAFQKLRTDVGQRSLAVRQREQAEIRNILTAEQRTKFDAAQAQRKKWMDEHAKDGRRGGKFGRGARPQRG